MPNFKVLIAVGIGVGVLVGGSVALFTSGKKPAPAASAPSAGSGSADAAPAPSDEARTLDERGKKLLYDGKYADASHSFRQAAALTPDPQYFFNLGTSLFQEGKFDEALAALEAVAKNSPTPLQVEKATKLRARVLDACKAQHLACRGESLTAP